MLLLMGVGAPEIMLILALALVIFGPKKIPEIGRSIGKGLREFKKSTSGLMDSLNSEIQETPKPAKQTAKAIESAAKSPEPEAKKEAVPEPEPVVINLEDEGKKS